MTRRDARPVPFRGPGVSAWLALLMIPGTGPDVTRAGWPATASTKTSEGERV